MKQSVNIYDFEREFKRFERNNFSWDGLKALFEYLEEYEEDTGEEIELDVVALCCDYAEYDSLNEYNSDYGTKYSEIDAIQYHTTLIKKDDNTYIKKKY